MHPNRIVGATALAMIAMLTAAHAAFALDAPVLQRGAPYTSTYPHLTWNGVNGAAAYEVRRGATCTSVSDYLPASGTTFDDVFVDLTHDSTYAYTVRALGPGTSSVDSNCVQVTVDVTAPQLSFHAEAQPDGSIALRWSITDSSPVTLVVRRGDANGGPPMSATQGSPVCNTPAGATGCVDAAVASGARYAYGLFAVDAVGHPNAATDSALARDTVAPSSPVGLTAVAGDGRLDVSWSAVPPVGADADVAGYRLVLKAGTAAPQSVIDGTPVCDLPSPTQTSCAVTGLTDGQPVSLTVFARDEVANWSTPVAGAAMTATPVAPPPPPPPPPPVPTPTIVDHQPPGRPTHVVAALTATGVALSWQNPHDADLDHVEVVRNAKRTPRSPSDGRRTGVGRATRLTFPARRGEHLHLALYAYDHAGNRSAAAEVELDIPKVLPAAGTSFAQAPQLSWAPVAKAAYYNVVVTRSGKRVAAGWPATTSWRPPKLKPGLYRWYVWPGFGPKSRATYGRLIGSSTFRIR